MVKFLLVLILLAPDGEGYQDHVAPFSTLEKCEKTLRIVQQEVLASEALHVIACVPVKGGIPI